MKRSAPSRGPQQPDILLAQQHRSQRNRRLMPQTRTNKQNLTVAADKSNSNLPSMPVIEALGTTASSKGSASPSEAEKQNSRITRGMVVLLHARSCSAPAGRCTWKYCARARNILRHVDSCCQKQCQFPHCLEAQTSLLHFQNCKDRTCRICASVYRTLKHTSREDLSVKNSSKLGVSQKENNQFGRSGKRAVDLNIAAQLSRTTEIDLNNEPRTLEKQEIDLNKAPGPDSPPHLPLKKKRRLEKTEIGPAFCSFPKPSPIFESAQMDMDPISLPGNGNLINHESSATVKDDDRSDVSALRAKGERHTDGTATKVEKSSLKNASIMDCFTSDEVRQHIISLKQGFSQSEEQANDGNCQLCQVGELCFEKRRIYCTPCGVRIKPSKACYMHSTNKHRYFACVQCYKKANETIQIESNMVPKAQFERKLNREECEEGWVMCDKCEKWQHQICALFNKHRNIGEHAKYICPDCYLIELERGERAPIPRSAMLGAKDLCRTRLSDFLEKRLFGRLAAERQERASSLGKRPEDIPGAEGLVIRVVSSVDKKLEVKPWFSEAFKEDNYPAEFPYKSKMILLFQEIEGVEVCLFSMYVQEFGTDCALPNQRSVYLAYLDSVKYLTPDIRTAKGEPLRTFVYHEILIGYMDYCKRRGFTSCYIWAYPPVKGNDYILYCHPTTQKTLNSDRLREWYLSMLRKGMTENIVVSWTNLYDHFFTNLGESKAKVTAVRVPYFDGDYWPRAVEDVMNEQKRIRETTICEHDLKAASHTNLNGHKHVDTMLMKKVGRKIRQTKDNFMVVHLQYLCNHCGNFMLSGTRWVCNRCQCFCLCDGCHKTELSREDRERHPVKDGVVHTFSPVMITGIASDTTDLDDTIERGCFEYRQAFLSLCEGNMYQFDTLRRAKHSSMMVLYHLHNPTAPVFVPACNNCTLHVEPGQEGQCDICRYTYFAAYIFW